MERTFIILKPDAVERKLVGEIISRIERKNYNIVQMKVCEITRQQAYEHYAHIKHLDIFEDMIDYVTNGPCVMMIVEGGNVIKGIRTMIGSTFDAAPGTIRGDYSSHRYQNLVHASDSVESFETETKRFFG